MIDLMAIAADRPRDRGHLHPARARLGERAAAEGRLIDPARLLPMLPPTIAGVADGGNGHGHGHGNGHGHGHGAGGRRPARHE